VVITTEMTAKGMIKLKIFLSVYPPLVFYLHSNTLKLNIRQSNLPYKNLRNKLLYFSNYFCLPFTACSTPVLKTPYFYDVKKLLPFLLIHLFF